MIPRTFHKNTESLRPKPYEALCAAWSHFGSQGWTAQRAGLVESVRISASRAKRECVFVTRHAHHSGLPTLTTLVLFRLPMDRFCLAARVRNKKRPPGRQRVFQWDIRAITTATATTFFGEAQSSCQSHSAWGLHRGDASASGRQH
jgi:hypothetical protein